MIEKKYILVAPLNWGLGHATRCIPIIRALLLHNFTPILASDGAALTLLENEFPNLICLKLPSYNITYAKKARFFKLKLLKDTPKILKNMAAENSEIAKIADTYKICGIISDNRFGAHHAEIPCVFITHQLQVLSGNTTWLSSKIHSHIIRKFNACWVPDLPGNNNLSGKMGHLKKPIIKTTYLGPLSRLSKTDNPIKYDILVLLSGPEPQRQFLETKLLKELATYNGTVLFVKGTVTSEVTKETLGHITVYNYLSGDALETAINESRLIISRSGYTTIMDLAKLEKKAFFIPTPGQFEQNYLAKRLQKNGLAPYCQQDDFTTDALKKAEHYTGLQANNMPLDYAELFSLFHAK